MKNTLISKLRILLLPLVLAAAARAQQLQSTILPDAVEGQPYSFQITTQPPQGPTTTYSANGLPVGLSVDSSSGLITGTTEPVGIFNGNLSLTANSVVTLYPFQITVDPAANTPVISSNGTISGIVGTPLSYTIVASDSPTSYNVAQLPAGLTSSGGVISGTPTTAGLFFTSVSANNSVGQGGILVLMFIISPAGPVPAVTSALVVTNPAGAAFTYTITASNSPTSFSATSLPSGLTLDTTTGIISGTPAAAGVSTVILSAANSFGSGPTVNLSLTIGAFSSITSPATLSATVGSPFSATLTADNSPYTFNLTGLPAGLSYNNVSGIISGTPTTAGSYTLAASANNAVGTGAEVALTLAVSNGTSGGGGNLTAPSILVQPQSQSATVGSNVMLSVTAVGSGTLTYQWTDNSIAISGATAPSLSLGFVQQGDAGPYAVTVTNSLGSVTSSVATLSILSLIVPPAITSEPYKTTATVGTAASFTVGASGSVPLSYQWWFGGRQIAGATEATLTIPSVQASDAGDYSVVITNPFGTATSVAAPLTVSTTPVAPIFQFQPAATTVTTGGTASLSVGVVGSSPILYQWYKDGNAIAGATSSSITMENAQPSDAGTYSVSIVNPGGAVTSADAALTVTAAGAPPVAIKVAQQPVPVSTAVGGSATFTIAVTGDPTVTYQWRKNQALIAGATTDSFTIPDAQVSDAGIYDVVVENGFSATISFPTLLTVTPAAGSTPTAPGSGSHLVNLSARGQAGTGLQTLQIGFVVEGSGTIASLVRAVGPTLATFGVTGFLADPQLTVFSSGIQLATDTGWGGSLALSNAFSESGAFPLPATSLDSALLLNLAPGPYTAMAGSASNGSGIVLLELYDANGAQETAHFANVSARGVAANGSSALTIGFVIAGSGTKSLLIRAVGPTLSQFSVTGALGDPSLTVFDSSGNAVATNAGWGGTAALTAAFSSVSAFPLPAGSKDSAVQVALPPGAYSAQVVGSSGDAGIALIEVYEMP